MNEEEKIEFELVKKGVVGVVEALEGLMPIIKNLLDFKEETMSLVVNLAKILGGEEE